MTICSVADYSGANATYGPVPGDALRMETPPWRSSSKGSTVKFGTILIDPPWRFKNRTGKIAPEHKRLARYETLSMDEIKALPVGEIAKDKSHLYLWTPSCAASGRDPDHA